MEHDEVSDSKAQPELGRAWKATRDDFNFHLSHLGLSENVGLIFPMK